MARSKRVGRVTTVAGTAVDVVARVAVEEQFAGAGDLGPGPWTCGTSRAQGGQEDREKGLDFAFHLKASVEKRRAPG